MNDINGLVLLIGETQHYFKQQASKQVDVALTLRNWFFGYYISEYELNGADRAAYGAKLFKEIAFRLERNGYKQIRERHLYLCKDFYLTYPQILRSLSAEFYISEFQDNTILRTASAKLNKVEINENEKLLPQATQSVSSSIQIDVNKLIFYELEAIKNAWSVRELQRAMNSLLFERTGLSTNKQAVLDTYNKRKHVKAEDVFRNPFILEFLGLKEEAEYSESQLEQAIINHLQYFLLELGKGFCFEARQKRITFDNKHYRIDLVFYHRILRCNVLIDLKMGEFTHADAGQMNVYLNYFTENEMLAEDNPPIGIILCASKNESLVRYATTGLAQQVFVNKYMLNLPNEEDLKKIIDEEQNKVIR